MAPVLSRGRGPSFHVPGTGALGIFLPVHHRHIVGTGGLKLPAQAAVHIGISSGINKHIFPGYGQIHMQFVKMSMAASQGTALKVEVIRISVPSGPEAPVSALLQGMKKAFRRLGSHALVFQGSIRPKIPDALKIQAVVSGIPEPVIL